MNYIDNSFKHGINVSVGEAVIIEPDVVVGDNVKIGHRATLKSGTRIGNDSIFDDHCITTGACYIGNNVNIRTGAIISRATIIEDKVFIGPGVITNHTKHVTHGRENKIEREELVTNIGFGSIIGSQASLLAGLNIGPQVIVGGGSVVVEDIEGYGVYVGSPCRRISNLPQDYFIENEPQTIGKMYLTDEIFTLFRQYMNALNLDRIVSYDFFD